MAQNHEEQWNKHRKLGVLLNIPIAAPTVARGGAVPTSSSQLQGSNGWFGVQHPHLGRAEPAAPMGDVLHPLGGNDSSPLPHRDSTGNYLHPLIPGTSRELPQATPKPEGSTCGDCRELWKNPSWDVSFSAHSPKSFSQHFPLPRPHEEWSSQRWLRFCCSTI